MEYRLKVHHLKSDKIFHSDAIKPYEKEHYIDLFVEVAKGNGTYMSFKHGGSTIVFSPEILRESVLCVEYFGEHIEA
jgi:hypothetical protein